MLLCYCLEKCVTKFQATLCGSDAKQCPRVQRRESAELQFWLVYYDFTWFTSSTPEFDNRSHVNLSQKWCFFCSVDFKHVGNLCGFRACCIQMQVFLSICCGNLKLRAVVSANRAKWPSIPPCRCGPQLWVILINFLKSVTFMCIYSVLPIYVEHFDTNESIND